MRNVSFASWGFIENQLIKDFLSNLLRNEEVEVQFSLFLFAIFYYIKAKTCTNASLIKMLAIVKYDVIYVVIF